MQLPFVRLDSGCDGGRGALTTATIGVKTAFGDCWLGGYPEYSAYLLGECMRECWTPYDRTNLFPNER